MVIEEQGMQKLDKYVITNVEKEFASYGTVVIRLDFTARGHRSDSFFSRVLVTSKVWGLWLVTLLISSISCPASCVGR